MSNAARCLVMMMPLLGVAACGTLRGPDPAEFTREVEAGYEHVYAATVRALGLSDLEVTEADPAAGRIALGTWEDARVGEPSPTRTVYWLERLSPSRTRVTILDPDATAGALAGEANAPLTVEQARQLHRQTLENVVAIALERQAE